MSKTFSRETCVLTYLLNVSLYIYFYNQLPYYIDADVKLSQTFAILKYLGRKHGLAGKNEAEQIRVDLIEAEAFDMRTKWVTLCYYGNFVSLNISNFDLNVC